MSHPNKRPVTVEDLLRLKREERPPAEFWDRFDRELRAKQLAALVEKRPWWQTMPRVFTGWRRYHLPLGATAALAITFISLRDVPDSPEAMKTVPRQEKAATAPVALATAAQPVNVPAPAAAGAVAAVAESEPTSDAVAPAAGSLAPGVASNLVSLGAVAEDSSARDALAPSARHIAANFAAARVAEPALGRGLLEAVPAAELRTLPRGAVVEPLAQMAPPGESRRARIISAVASGAMLDTATRAGERIARNLSDERLTEEAIRRIKMKGAGVSLKM